MFPRNMAGQFVSGSTSEDECTEPEVPFGFHCVSRSEAEQLVHCDWLGDENSAEMDEEDYMDGEDIYSSDIILADHQDLTHEENRRVREAVADAIAFQEWFKHQKPVVTLDGQTLYRSDIPLDGSYYCPKEEWEPGSSLHDVDDDEMYRPLPVEPEVIEIWRIGLVEIADNSYGHNRKGRRCHSGNDTRRLREGDRKLIGGKHSRTHKAFVPTQALAHIEVDGLTFKVGRVA